MRKLLLFVVIIFMSWASQAQIEKGKFLLSGGIQFSNTTEKFEIKTSGRTEKKDGDKITRLGLNLDGGAFISNNIALGIGLGYAIYKESWVESNIDEYINTNWSLSISPFLRLYKPYNEKVSFYGEFTLGLGLGEYIETVKKGSATKEDIIDYYATDIGFIPGFTYMFSEKIALEMRFGFIGYSSYGFKLEGYGDNYLKYSKPEFGLKADLSTLKFALTFIL